MSEPNNSPEFTSPEVNLTQNIQTKLKAADSHASQCWRWSIEAKKAEANNTPIPVEPRASDEAVAGNELYLIESNSYLSTHNIIFSQDSLENETNLPEIINQRVKEISDSLTGEEKIMALSGVIQALNERIFPALDDKVKIVAGILDEAPEPFYLLPQSDKLIHELDLDNPDNSKKLNNPDILKILKYSVSEKSPLDPKEKLDYSFLLDKAKAILLINESKTYDKRILIETISKTLELSTESVTKATDDSPLGNINRSDKFIDDIRLPRILSNLHAQYNSESLKNIVLSFNSELVRQKFDPKGNVSTAEKQFLLQEVSKSTIDLVGVDALDYRGEVWHNSTNPAYKEVFSMLQSNQLLKDRVIKELKQIKSNQETTAQQQKYKIAEEEKLILAKHNEAIVKQFKDNTDIQHAIANLGKRRNSELPLRQQQLDQVLNSIEAREPLTTEVVAFAKLVSNEYVKIRQANLVLVEKITEKQRHKKNIFSNKDVVTYQSDFTLNQDLFLDAKGRLEEEIKDNPSLENYAKLEVLNFLISSKIDSTIPYSQEEERK